MEALCGARKSAGAGLRMDNLNNALRELGSVVTVEFDLVSGEIKGIWFHHASLDKPLWRWLSSAP